MGSRALERAQLNGACLASDLSCDVACEIIRCAGELFVPECVDEVNALPELAHIAAVRQADPFGYGDYDGWLPGQELFYLIPECLDVEWQFWQIDEIREWVARPEEGAIINPNEADSIEVELLTGYKYLLNVGSIGQPRNKDPRASFAVYDSDERRVTRYRLPYDIRTTQEKILAAQLPERLASRLERGS